LTFSKRPQLKWKIVTSHKEPSNAAPSTTRNTQHKLYCAVAHT